MLRCTLAARMGDPLMRPNRGSSASPTSNTRSCLPASERLGIDVSFDCEDILARGDLAAIRTTASGTLTIRATGQTMPAKFRELFVLERVNGDWKIARYMFQQMAAQ